VVWAVIATLGSPSAINQTVANEFWKLQGRGPRAMEALIAAAEGTIRLFNHTKDSMPLDFQTTAHAASHFPQYFL
jgi:hypothetical protein